MLFRREYSKINRGLSCRCSIGEFWVLVVCFYRCPRENFLLEGFFVFLGGNMCIGAFGQQQ